MNNLKSTLAQQSIIYVTRDIERALGLPLDTKGYFIISNFTPFAKGVTKNKKNVLLIKEKELLDTWELLQHPKTISFLSRFSPLDKGEIKRGLKNSHSTSPRLSLSKERNYKPVILVFKNTLQIEKTCKENGWQLLNPPAELSNKVEEKISQLEWLGPLKKYLPKYSILKCKDVKFINKSFILQFNRSHTGSGTMLIESTKQLEEIQQKFPEREVRIAEYIVGPLFTNNNVVTNAGILHGNINYQITGLKPFTDNPFSTIGNDWALPHKILTKKQILQYKKIATDAGQRLKKSGWRGLFGIDVVMDEKTGRLYLLEINCRQPASTTYESQLQSQPKTYKLKPKTYLTTFEAHLSALQNFNLRGCKLIEIKVGAQVIQRVLSQKSIKSIKSKVTKLKKQKFNVIQYQTTTPNSDLIRIQSKTGIMSEHNEFNEVGKKIVKILI